MTNDGWLYSAGEYPPGIKPFSRQAPWMDVDPPVRDYCGPACRALADQARRIADLEQSVRDWREIARRHHDIAEQLRLAVEDHERTCHALPDGCTHWTTEEAECPSGAPAPAAGSAATPPAPEPRTPAAPCTPAAACASTPAPSPTAGTSATPRPPSSTATRPPTTSTTSPAWSTP